MPVYPVHQIGVGARAASAIGAAGLAALFALTVAATRHAQADSDTRTLTLHHIHTGEDVTITFKKNGQYDETALKKLNHFVRDWRKDEDVRMDPRLFDMMWEVQQEVGYKGAIHIVCGYRSPATNSMLRHRSSGVARTSLHMQGKAMDFSLPGANVAAVRAAALRIQGGGVGYYPTSGVPFVHMDVGNVRHWPRMTRDQLAKVFPDGRTLHIPTDGNPLPGYALALADHERGNTDRLMNRPKTRNLLASLFKGPPDAEEVADKAALQQRAATAPTTAPAARRAMASLTPDLPAEDVKPVPLPRGRPMFEIASAESRPVPPPSGPIKFAALTPNEVINARGYWQGPQEVALQNIPAGRRLNDADLTASLGRALHKDRVPPEVALAYASREPMPNVSAPATVTRRGTASIATKPAEPAPAVRAVASRLDDPWLRAVILAPRVQGMMTTSFGPPDLTGLQPYMQKPASAVMMTFSADPHLGMSFDQFTGSAVVFQATVTFGTRTAALQN